MFRNINLKRNKFSLGCLFLCGIMFLIVVWFHRRPQYIKISIPLPEEASLHSEIATQKWISLGNNYIYRQEIVIGCEFGNKCQFTDTEYLIEYYEEFFSQNDWQNTLEDYPQIVCEDILVESHQINSANGGYVAHFFPKGTDQKWKNAELCFGILPNQDGSHNLYLVTSNPHWYEVLLFEFSHPRSG